MPLTQLTQLTPDISFALWHIEESLPAMEAQYDFNEADRVVLSQHKVESRKMEWLSARLALNALMKAQGLTTKTIYKDDCGKPHIAESEAHISISHTTGWGAAVLSKAGPVGIDIEFPKPQVQRIARKFLHADERTWTGEDMERLTWVWSAKEALYKLHGRTQLIFASQLYIHAPEAVYPGKGEIREAGECEAYRLHFEKHDNLITCITF